MEQEAPKYCTQHDPSLGNYSHFDETPFVGEIPIRDTLFGGKERVHSRVRSAVNFVVRSPGSRLGRIGVSVAHEVLFILVVLSVWVFSLLPSF